MVTAALSAADRSVYLNTLLRRSEVLEHSYMALSPSLQDMVAYLYPGGRPTSARQTNGDLRHTTVKLVPRQGITAAWRDQLMDACNVHGCARLLDEADPPTFDVVLAQTSPTCDLQTARHLHQMMTDEWRVENTVLYHVLRGSITLTELDVYQEALTPIE